LSRFVTRDFAEGRCHLISRLRLPATYQARAEIVPLATHAVSADILKRVNTGLLDDVIKM
jgi:hypothetical protein